MNANISQSETVTVTVEGRIAIAFPVETATVTKSGNCVVCRIKSV